MSEQPKCTLSNAELLAAVETWVSKLCDTGGRAWTLSVPVNFNRDPDMLITGLRKRYAALLARHNALREAVAKMRHANNKNHWDALEWIAACAEVDRLLEGENDV